MANNALAQVAKFQALQSLGFASISSSYAAVGSVTTQAGRLVNVSNYTNALLFFSVDGVTDHFVLSAGSAEVFDLCTNKTDKGFYLSAGTVLYVRDNGSSPTSGDVYFSLIYGDTRS